MVEQMEEKVERFTSALRGIVRTGPSFTEDINLFRPSHSRHFNYERLNRASTRRSISSTFTTSGSTTAGFGI